jgi:hypothetical protein
MSRAINFALASALCLAAGVAGAADATPAKDEHEGHHPPATQAAPERPAAAKPPAADTSRVDAQLKQMHHMRDRMAAAKTPQEAADAKAAHMKSMKDGMAMMKDMSPKSAKHGKAGSHHDVMEKRMEMMQAMMEMMMDRMPAEK